MPAFYHNFPQNTLKCFKGYNLLWHVAAIILTYILVTSGFDWLYYTSTRNPLLQSFLYPAVRLGGRVPIIAPIALFVFGKVRKNMKAVGTANALGQSVLIGLLISSLYKACTGRAHPLRSLVPDAIDISREFLFGFMRGGIFWGWPSSHTTIAVAMAVTLLVLYQKNEAIRYLAVLYALYVGFGVSISIHWFSDFAAGTVFGTVIGTVVGKSFRGSIAEENKKEEGVP